MKKIICLLTCIFVFVSCNNNVVDLEKASIEAEAFINSQFNFFNTGNIEDGYLI